MNSYYGELIAFCTTLSWSIGIFPFTEASRRLGPDAVNHFRLLLALLMLTVIFLFQNSFSVMQLIDSPDPGQWIWFGLSGVVGLALGDYFGFTAFAILGTRLGSLFTCFAPGAALLFGYVMLNEDVNFIGLSGIIITIAGVMYISLSKEEKAAVSDLGFGDLRKGIIYGILAALCQGVGLVLAKKGMSSSDVQLNPVHATWIRMIVASGAIYIVTLMRGRLAAVHAPVRSNQNKGVGYAVMGTLFGPVIGVCFSMYAVTLVQVSVAQTIFSMVPVVVLPLALIFTNEKLSLKTAAGALIAIAGVFILIWRDQLTGWMFH